MYLSVWFSSAVANDIIRVIANEKLNFQNVYEDCFEYKLFACAIFLATETHMEDNTTWPII